MDIAAHEEFKPNGIEMQLIINIPYDITDSKFVGPSHV
jgi:hypothetical protein